MEPKTKTLVLDAVTCIDYGWITPQGTLEGRSMTPTFLVTGPVEEMEAVVCDFGTIKRRIKELIDHPVTGFDHKCVAPLPHLTSWGGNSDNSRSYLTTPYLNADVPKDAVRWLHTTDIGYELSEYLTAGTGFSITVIPGTVPVLPQLPGDCGFPSEPIVFNYCHPLKNSSSWGCRNGLHGHTSYVRPYWVKETCWTPGIGYIVFDLIRRQLSKYYVHLENVVREDLGTDGGTVTVEYSALGRGAFRITLPASDVVVLPTETTVEYLGDFILAQVRDQLALLYHTVPGNLKGLMVSEGLYKGVWVPNI